MFGKIPEKLIDFIQGKLKVSLYAKGTDEGDTALKVVSKSAPNLRTSLMYGENISAIYTLNGDDRDTTSYALWVAGMNHMFNETGWDRARNNTEITLLPTAERTTTAYSSNQTNYNAKGVFITFKITSGGGTTDTVQLSVEIDTGNGYTTIFLGDATASGSYGARYVIYPGASLGDSIVDSIAPIPLPRKWRVVVLHSGTTAFTYSVTACYIL